MIDHLLVLFDPWRDRVAAEGIVRLKIFDEEGDLPRVALLDAELGNRIVQVQMWDAGDADIEVGDLSTGAVLSSTHSDLKSRDDIHRMLEELLVALRSPN